MSSSTLEPSTKAASQHTVKNEDAWNEPETALPDLSTRNEPEHNGSKRSRRLIDLSVMIREVEDPRSYGRPFKWLITTLVALAATLDFMGATILYRNSCRGFCEC